MFIITMPKAFEVGQTLPCKINGRPEKLSYVDANTLRIEGRDGKPAETKIISWVEPSGKVQGVESVMFWCQDDDGTPIVRITV